VTPWWESGGRATPTPTPACRAITAAGTSGPRSANSLRAVFTIRERLRSASARNFTGDGGPISLHLDGADRTGHAAASVDGEGQVTVTVRLDN
jgi:hypothetical protein